MIKRGSQVVQEQLDLVSRRRAWASGIFFVFLAALTFAKLEFRSPILDHQLEAWHRDCDAHVGEPVETPAARALHELIVYAEMKGRSSRAAALTAFAKQIGWSRE